METTDFYIYRGKKGKEYKRTGETIIKNHLVIIKNERFRVVHIHRYPNKNIKKFNIICVQDEHRYYPYLINIILRENQTIPIYDSSLYLLTTFDGTCSDCRRTRFKYESIFCSDCTISNIIGGRKFKGLAAHERRDYLKSESYNGEQMITDEEIEKLVIRYPSKSQRIKKRKQRSRHRRIQNKQKNIEMLLLLYLLPVLVQKCVFPYLHGR
jgi:hypothetical protein